jgi:hypothetical protein
MVGPSLRRWRNKRFTRWVTSVVSVALLMAVSAFLAHQHERGHIASNTDQTCELCLQLTTVGAPAAVSVPHGLPPVQCLLPADTAAEPTLRLAHSYRSRAPPRS